MNLLGVCLMSVLIATAIACKCRPPITLYSAWLDQTDIVKAEVISGSISSGAYKVWVTDVFSGCAQSNSTLLVTTPRHSAACGVSLTVGQDYLLTGSLYQNALSIISCSYTGPWSRLSVSDITFLGRMYNNCTGQCYGAKPQVKCFVDPCATRSCTVQNATCYSNYCGGCNADFIFDGQLVCV
eukprot:TRINITY_DN1318_c0_g1_i1.p1 TRINITY_DN1318_c0_g1~~TRINITY_DN1318_c0_g1_i1.p1  ORF type:complete len:183 (-),score=13.02 TRINITY_DN1318_c0_g1_i1:52-600(-)